MADWGDPLDTTTIAGGIDSQFRPLLSRVEILEETDSTNDELLRLPAAERHGLALLAERQLAGKGRRGRGWQSPGGNIYLSLGWHFDCQASSLGVLGAVAGICTCRSLSRIGLANHGLKWPNDVLVGAAKLGGILVELRGARSGCDAVIGIGINVRLAEKAAAAIDQPWTDLASQPGITEPGRNRVVASIVEELLACLGGSGRSLADFLAEHWSRWDLLEGQEVLVDRGDAVFAGTAGGITPRGALRLLVSAVNGEPAAGEVMEFHSGGVSVRRG